MAGEKKHGGLLLVAAVLLVNSGAVTYGSYRVSRLEENLRWSVADVIRSTPQFDAPERDKGTVRVDLFSDLGCQHCRASALAVDSARKRFGRLVSWRYWHVTKPPSEDSLSFLAALMAVCAETEDSPWTFYKALAGADDWSIGTLQEALSNLGYTTAELRPCLDSAETEARVWNDLFTAARLGVQGTPTMFVDGVQVIGKLETGPLIQLLEAKITERERSGL
jgi:protein-disulfide isomerase